MAPNSMKKKTKKREIEQVEGQRKLSDFFVSKKKRTKSTAASRPPPAGSVRRGLDFADVAAQDKAHTVARAERAEKEAENVTGVLPRNGEDDEDQKLIPIKQKQESKTTVRSPRSIQASSTRAFPPPRKDDNGNGDQRIRMITSDRAEPNNSVTVERKRKRILFKDDGDERGGDDTVTNQSQSQSQNTPKTRTAKYWEILLKKIKEKYSDNKYLLEHHLGQLELEQRRASFHRPASAATAEEVSSTTNPNHNNLSQEPTKKREPSEEQKRVADHPPNIPLSVRAGAGSGKTQTMVTRAIQLVKLHQLDPSEILMLTFTKKAAMELRERIHAEFEKGGQSQQIVLPTVKTFHSLAFSWVRVFWRLCGLAKYPNLLVTTNEQKKFMEKVIKLPAGSIRRTWQFGINLPRRERRTDFNLPRQFDPTGCKGHVKGKQLKWCLKTLKIKQGSFSNKDQVGEKQKGWDHVIDYMKENYPECYERARDETDNNKKSKNNNKSPSPSLSNKKKTDSTFVINPIQKGMEIFVSPSKQAALNRKPGSAKTKGTTGGISEGQNNDHPTPPKKKPKTAKADSTTTTPQKKTGLEAEKRKETELDLLTRSELERQCYLALLRQHVGKQNVGCPFERCWPADTDRCKRYLKMVENARLGQHSPEEYLPNDAAILRCYEREQERTGNIDFDKLLNLFVGLLDSNQNVKTGFHEKYSYVVVDEYQDNSEVQSKLLLKMVTQGRVTVVGDDDQCIYEFRGASPGNFDEFQQHYSSSTEADSQPAEAKLLTNNYRSTKNILEVAESFLDDMHFHRGEKQLWPTREAGEPVRLRTCLDPLEQARLIAKSIRKRHDEGNIPYREMACLFRCYQMGKYNRDMHKPLQEQLSINKIPFKVTGGASFLNSEVVRDLVAYMNLTLTGGPERMDDASFARILNKPTRGLPTEALQLIQAQKSKMERASIRPVGLEEAALALLDEDTLLSKSRREGLGKFFDLLKRFRVAAVGGALPELVLHIWDESGLAKLHGKKASKAAEKEGGRSSQWSVSQSTEAYRPGNIEMLVSVATSHAKEWKTLQTPEKKINSLFNLAKKSVIENADKTPRLPQLCLPQPLLDELHMPGGRGLPVVDSFLTDLALQMADEDEDDGKADKVTISTIHRAKGLEWQDVYVPYFNEGYMPTAYRDGNGTYVPARHKIGCPAREASARGGLSCGCAQYFANLQQARCGMTAEQRHEDEERRLAHVAATRAKDRLVFVSVSKFERERARPSSFEDCLAELPASVYQKGYRKSNDQTS